MNGCVIDGQKIDRNGLLKLKIETAIEQAALETVPNGQLAAAGHGVINNEVQKLPLDPAQACVDLKTISHAMGHQPAPKM